MDDIGLWESRSFRLAVLYCHRSWVFPDEILNVNGGSISIVTLWDDWAHAAQGTRADRRQAAARKNMPLLPGIGGGQVRLDCSEISRITDQMGRRETVALFYQRDIMHSRRFATLNRGDGKNAILSGFSELMPPCGQMNAQ